MRASCVIGSSLLVLALSFWSRPVAAQHQKPAGHAGAGQVHVPQGHPGGNSGMMPAPSPAQEREMQRQMQAMMQEQMKQQEQMMKMHQQAYEQHMQKFRDFAASNGGPSSQGQGSSASGMPSSPAAMQHWLSTQKHNKALKKPYDSQYDQYLEFHKANQAQAKTKTKTKAAATEANEETKLHHSVHALAVGSAIRLPLAQDQPSLSLLRTVHRKLQTADHDYDGHRVNAMHHISSAIHHLTSTAPYVGTSQTNVGTSPSSGSMPQSHSDAILRDALLKLNTVENHLSGITSLAAHHANARTAVAASIQELHTALSIR